MFKRLRGSPYFYFSSRAAIFVFFLHLSSACSAGGPDRGDPRRDERLKHYPPVILWAWERPEDLRFLDASRFGVAFLAQTLVLRGGSEEVVFRPRRQPLEVSPDTFLIAVTRVETDKNRRPSLSAAQKGQVIDYVRQTLKLPRVKALQLDFDVTGSERDFYRAVVKELRALLPGDVSLTMTALASWCAEDVWFADLPVDEAVPMAFRMGADDKTVRDFLASGKDWRADLCRSSYGVALDEPVRADFKPGRRFYVFSNRAWRPEDLKRLPKEVSP